MDKFNDDVYYGHMKFLGLWVGIFLLAGCAGGARFRSLDSVPSDKAVVYVYRPKQIVGWGGLIPVNSPWHVCPNGQNCVSLLQGGYCVFSLDPGTNVFTSSLESASVMLDVAHRHGTLCTTNLQGGAVYYFKFGMGAMRAKLRGVDAGTAIHELANYRLESP
jgi:hypothetical protein